jgi:hypothetical protein
LLEEMQVGHAEQTFARQLMPAGAGVLRVNGPILQKHIGVFGAKLGLALHYEAHGSPAPAGGGVQPMLFTNVSALRGELPAENILGDIQTDRGNLHVDSSPHVIRLTTITLWHFDAGSGRSR